MDRAWPVPGYAPYAPCKRVCSDQLRAVPRVADRFCRGGRRLLSSVRSIDFARAARRSSCDISDSRISRMTNGDRRKSRVRSLSGGKSLFSSLSIYLSFSLLSVAPFFLSASALYVRHCYSRIYSLLDDSCDRSFLLDARHFISGCDGS